MNRPYRGLTGAVRACITFKWENKDLGGEGKRHTKEEYDQYMKQSGKAETGRAVMNSGRENPRKKVKINVFPY
ncbi:MAG: hypothetical protein E3J72_18450 [Planctomycetota bacterium]|nr:MAG: hypothetical protein E3J72_18450 [Planctomycetota bacterium]